MMTQKIKCPTKDELDAFIFALNNPNYVPVRNTEGGIQGVDETLVERVRDKIYAGALDDYCAAYKYMRQWGNTPQEAVRNYEKHFFIGDKKVCDVCSFTYAEILSDHVSGYELPPEATQEEFQMKLYIEKAHRELLGSRTIRSYLGHSFPLREF